MGPKVISDDLEIIGIFKSFSQREQKLWCWQNQQRRVVHFSVISKVDAIKKQIYLKPCNKTGYRFDESLPIYLCCKQRGVACRVSIRGYSSESMIVSLPTKLTRIDEELVTKLDLVEKDNEDQNLHKRTVARKSPSEVHVAGLKRIEHSKTLGLEFYDIYDISAGGMGLIIDNPAEFIAGEMLVVQSINSKDLPTNLSGTIVSIRQIDGSDKFKVGVKFLE